MLDERAFLLVVVVQDEFFVKIGNFIGIAKHQIYVVAHYDDAHTAFV